MHIEQLMSHPVHTCQPDDPASVAAQLMWEHDCGVIPVVNGDGAVVGIVTDRDLCMAAYTQGKPLGKILVSSAMARDVFGCRPQDSIETVEHLMRDKHIRRVPVLNPEGKLVGLISLNDIVRDAATRGRNSNDRQLTRTMAAICEPRRPPPPQA